MAGNERETQGAGSDVAAVILAGLLGALIGAGLALLLAPKTGAELRSEIREKAGVVAEKAQVVQQKAKDLAEAARQKLEERRGQREAAMSDEPSLAEKA